jgi:hypothetical protein
MTPRHYRPRLTASQAAEISHRYARGESSASLAAEFAVSTATVVKVVNGTYPVFPDRFTGEP